MLSRRQLLSTAGATLALAGCATARPAPLPPAPAPLPPPGPDANAQLTKLLDALFEEVLDDTPELVTQLGLDKGPRADAKRRL